MKLSDWFFDNNISVKMLHGELYFLLKYSLNKNNLLVSDVYLTDEDLKLINHRYALFCEGYPISYIFGEHEFLDLLLEVNKHVLIPRSATEQMILKILSSHEEKDLDLIDIGTGSGCIAVALKYYRPAWNIVACDNSPLALEVAKKNACKYDLDINFILADLYDKNTLPDNKWDIIVSNPPYLAENEWANLHKLHFEPKAALVDKYQNGLSCYESLIDYAQQNLKPDGEIWLEHGSKQKKDICEKIISYKVNIKKCFKDYSGLDRILVCGLSLL